MLVNAAVVCLLLVSLVHATNSNTQSTTIIDLLSGAPQFSILLQHLQRTGLVPILNESKNITLIAPTNDAFASVADHDVTKSRLLYHMLTQTLFVADLNADLVINTFLDSSSLAIELNKPKLDNSDLYPLPVYVSYSHISSTDPTVHVGKALIVEPDFEASSNVVQGVDRLLDVPLSVCDFLKGNAKTTKFSLLFEKEFNCSLPMLQAYSTVLVPTDKAFDSLNEAEWGYLLTSWGEDDRIAILCRHILESFWATPLIESSVNATTMDGTQVLLDRDMTADGLKPVDSNVLASDAALHLYDKFITPSRNLDSLITFTPQKVCIGLGAHDFVEEIKFRKLLYLLDGNTTEPQTVFVPIRDPDEPFSVESTNTALYHFVYGQHELDFDTALNTNVLLESKSNHKKLGYGNQRIKVMVSESTSSLYLNGRDTVITPGFTVGNTTIYGIKGTLDLPPTLDLAVGSVFQSAQSATYLNKLGLLDLPTKKGWTVLLPTNMAWERLGLVKTYLESNQTAMIKVLESLIISKPFYSDSESLDTKLLNGNAVKLQIQDDTKDFSVSGGYYGGTRFTLIINSTSYHVETPNILTSTGVVHSVSDLHIPHHVDITPEHILSSANTGLFASLLHERGFGYVMDPDNSYTILAPSNGVLRASNLTSQTENIDKLLRMHVIPANPVKQFLDDGIAVETLEPGVHLMAKELTSGLFLVNVVEGDGHEIRVLNRGDSSVRDARNITTVLYVDRYISPEWVQNGGIGSPPFRLKTGVAVLLGVVFGAMLIFGVLSCGLFVFLGYARKAHQSGDGQRKPLLSRRSSRRMNGGTGEANEERVEDDGYANAYGSMNSGQGPVAGVGSRRSSIRSNRSIQSMTSEHSISEPISTTRVQQNREHGRHLGLPKV